MAEKKSATRRAVEEKHLSKPQLVLRIDNGSVNIISGSAVSSSHAVESSFLVIVVITTLGVQMIIPKQERRVMLSARFVAINKRYLVILFIQNLINVEMDKLHLDYMRFPLMLSSSLRSTRTPKPVLDVKQSSQHISALCVNTSRAQTKIHITA